MRWHHRPVHLFEPKTTYIITAGTMNKEYFFKGRERLSFLQDNLFAVTSEFNWELQSWAIFSNHYHVIAKSPENSDTLKKMIQKLHSVTSININKLDCKPGRKIWFEYWDTCLTYEKSYLARLHYVNNNPVHHKLMRTASEYEFCSASFIETHTDKTFRNKVMSFNSEKINIEDDF